MTDASFYTPNQSPTPAVQADFVNVEQRDGWIVHQ